MRLLFIYLLIISVPTFADSCHTGEAHGDHAHSSGNHVNESHPIVVDDQKIRTLIKGKQNVKVAVISVKGMVCDFCARGLEKTFKKDSSVITLDVDLKKGMLLIVYNKNKEILFSEIKKKIIANGQEPIAMEIREI